LRGKKERTYLLTSTEVVSGLGRSRGLVGSVVKLLSGEWQKIENPRTKTPARFSSGIKTPSLFLKNGKKEV